MPSEHSDSDEQDPAVCKFLLNSLSLCDTNSYCIHNMFKYTKSIEVNPHKNKHMKMGQYSMKSQKRKAPASVESRMGGRNKKCVIVYPSAAETRGSDAMSLHHQNSFKLCGTESCWGSYKPTERCSNQSTNSRKKNTHFCPEIADAN